MGATTFTTIATAPSARVAFALATEQACYDHGHSGYTGTIAEKDSYTMIELPEGQDAYGYINKLIEDCDDRIDDKWGPAGCIDLKNGSYLFFGWASC